MINICNKCFKPIKKKDDFFEVNNYLKGKLVRREYMHLKCHLEANKSQELALKSLNDVGKGILKTFGMDEKAVFEIAGGSVEDAIKEKRKNDN